MSRITPRASDSPSAVSAKSPPSSAPETRAVTSVCPLAKCTQAPASRTLGRGEEQLAGLAVLGPHHLGLAALPLQLRDRQLRGVLLVELHRPDHVGLVGPADRLVDLGQILLDPAALIASSRI